MKVVDRTISRWLTLGLLCCICRSRRAAVVPKNLCLGFLCREKRAVLNRELFSRISRMHFTDGFRK